MDSSNEFLILCIWYQNWADYEDQDILWWFTCHLILNFPFSFKENGSTVFTFGFFVEKNNFYAFIGGGGGMGGSDQLPWSWIHHICLTCFHLLLSYGKAWVLINENQINQILWHICVCPCPKLSTYQVLLLWYAGMNFNWFTCVY